MARPALWTSIAETLQAEIASGRYGPGDRLPTEAQFATRFGVNRHTVRRALAALAERGLIASRRGAGAFVSARPTDYPLGRRVRFHRNILAAGRTPAREILLLDTRAADAGEAEALTLETGAAVHVCEGLSFADGQPIGLFRSVFPADRFPALLGRLRATNSVTRALAGEGVADYTRVSTRITATTASPAQARHLRLQPGAPILRSVSVNADPEGRPVEYGRTWFAGERVTLTLTPD